MATGLPHGLGRGDPGALGRRASPRRLEPARAVNPEGKSGAGGLRAELNDEEDADGAVARSDAGLVAQVDRLSDELMGARAEIARLQEENERLRSAAEQTRTSPVHRSQRTPRLFPLEEEAPAEVDGDSPPEDKLRLFRCLFAGREDVYPQRWENQSTKKSGWSPRTLDGHRSPALAAMPRWTTPLSARTSRAVSPPACTR
jgi:hypothetical protein